MKKLKNRNFQYLLLTIGYLLFTTLLGQTLEVKKISPRTVISVVKRVEQEYYLVTKNQPLELSVAGPNWLRVYTRLLWHSDLPNKQTYKFLLTEGDKEKVVTLETERSGSARGANKESYGKWRSLFLEIPSGLTNYKFTLLEAKSETVALRFNFEKPQEYKKKTPEFPATELQLVEKEKLTTYYQTKPNSPIKLKVEGPIKLKSVCRLNYDYTLEGRQSFTISAVVQGKEWQSKTFRVSKSETGLYKNAPQYIPSTPGNFFVNVPPGTFLIEFHLKGGLAKSAGLAFYTKPLEPYE